MPTMQKIKAGDKVYYPAATNGILTVGEMGSTEYWSSEGTQFVTVRPDGKFYSYHQNQTIFPATQEWYDKLVHVYPNLEEPHKHKTSKQIVEAMLESGRKFVTCWVSDTKENPGRADRLAAIQALSYSYKFVDEVDDCWLYATPFDAESGRNIIDFVDGKVILED